MSKKHGRIKKNRFHGDTKRFEAVAEFIACRYGKDIKYIADVAGGQGMLSRILHKKYNYHIEVIDPRRYQLIGVPSRAMPYTSDMADYYDLIIGLHPDEATREIAKSAIRRPVVLIPCCNFWIQGEKLGSLALVEAIEQFYTEQQIPFERVIFDFEGPKNIGLISAPPSH